VEQVEHLTRNSGVARAWGCSTSCSTPVPPAVTLFIGVDIALIPLAKYFLIFGTPILALLYLQNFISFNW
jgi:hypothetical protein